MRKLAGAMHGFLMALLVLTGAGDALGQADTYHEPLKPNQYSGGLVGTIANAPGDLQRVIAVEPFELKAYAAELDTDTGGFELRGLPPGEYDLLIKSVGHVHEGLTLEPDPLTDPDADKLQAMVEGVGETLYPSERYFDVKHIVRLTGNDEISRSLVTFTRTRPSMRSDQSDVDGHIRRFALVRMVHTRDVWQIETVRHLLRQEVPENSDDIELTYTHSPDLGQFLVGERVHDLGEIDLQNIKRGDSSKYASDRHREIWDDD
ncbi:MAG: hypothetical protein ACODAQ_00955 [Phycisphaeraceae bacterium]